jgi:hypothetical protein
MSASPVHYHKSTVRSVSMLSALLRHLNTSTLAFALFVALALLNAIHGKEPETKESAHARDGELELAIGPCDTSLPARQEIQGHKSIAKDFRNKVTPNR